MFSSINAAYRRSRLAAKDRRLILESVLDVEETIPGSEEDLEDVTDPDSVPEDVYKALDKELDRIVTDPSYDDTEADELLDDDFDEDEVDDSVLDAIMDETIALADMAKARPEVLENYHRSLAESATTSVVEAAMAKLMGIANK